MAAAMEGEQRLAWLAVRLCYLSVGFMMARMCHSAGLIHRYWLEDPSGDTEKTWLQFVADGHYGKLLDPFLEATARNGMVDIISVYVNAASGTFLLSGYLYDLGGLKWRSKRFVRKWALNVANACMVIFELYLAVCALGPSECHVFRQGFVLFQLYAMVLAILLFTKHWLNHLLHRLGWLASERDEAVDSYFKLGDMSHAEGTEASFDAEATEESMDARLKDFWASIRTETHLAAQSASRPGPKELLKARGSLLMQRHFALMEGRNRILTLLSLWIVRLPSRKGIALIDYLLSYFPRWIMFVAFWFHTMMLGVELVMVPVASMMKLNSVGLPECASVALYLGTAIVAAAASALAIQAYGLMWIQGAISEMARQKKYQWEESTAGFPGKRKTCVVSMSGLDQEFWFGIKDTCKDMGIGFACLWEEDWGSSWWDHWKQNVQDFGVGRGHELVVLVDPSLRERGITENQRELLLGNAQQQEVTYVMSKGLAITFYTNEAFAAKLQDLREGSI